MKKKLIIGISVVVVFYALIFFWSKENKISKKHPTLHSAAEKPDEYLLEASNYEEMHLHDKSAYSIEEAIQAIWKLEQDVDDESFERLEETIRKLELVHRKIVRDSIPSKELLTIFEYALSNLAHAELEVAEKYSKSSQPGEAKSALRYAQVHIKNALLLHSSVVAADTAQLEELQLLEEMNSLITQSSLIDPANSASLDQLIKQLDDLIVKMERN